MNYAWEVLLKADMQKIPRENVRFLPNCSASPYMEVAFENLNTAVLEDAVVELNPLYRFAEIFSTVLDCNLAENSHLREILFDTAMHYFSQLDLRQGFCKDEYYLQFILKDFMTCYGEEIACALQKFTEQELRAVLLSCILLYKTGTSVWLFRRIMKELYADSFVYLNNDVFRELLIYVGQKETEAEQVKINFLISVFLPLNYQVLLFWEKHFGIIGVAPAMCMDEIMLF